jgi:hypothetical protein
MQYSPILFRMLKITQLLTKLSACHVHMGSKMDPILSQMSLTHTFTPYFFKIYFKPQPQMGINDSPKNRPIAQISY